ncbi:MAG: CsbD family protein [Chloroflexi bacterium]|nr:CsbD family protein [Chloroflexota bacterium]
MNTHMLQGKWKQIRGKVTEQWGHIADHDLDKIVGKRDQLVGLVQEKYGYTKEKAEQDVDFFLKKMNLRPKNDNHAPGILAISIGSLLTVAVFLVLVRRLASA